MKPEKPPRHKGKPLPRMSETALNTVLVAQTMEIIDDLTLLRMRAKQLLDLLNSEGEK